MAEMKIVEPGVRLEQSGREVRLIFVSSTVARATALSEEILSQLKAGCLYMTNGRPAKQDPEGTDHG